jgi:hypothetical protein
VYTRGSCMRARRKRWFLAVAGSRTGYPLQGEVHGGMTLVFACRGPPCCSKQRYVTAVWLPLGGASRGGGFLRLAVLRRLEPALFCVIERLCVTALEGLPAVPLAINGRLCPHAPAAGCSDRAAARADAGYPATPPAPKPRNWQGTL